MSRSQAWLPLLCLLLAPATSAGQTIQLPTFRVFSVNTTVSVPDRGAAYLGGVSRSSSASSTRGVPGLSKLPVANRLFKNRGIGRVTSSSGVYATATITDLRELDRAVLAAGLAGAGGEAGDLAVERKADFLSRHVSRRSSAGSDQPALVMRPQSGARETAKRLQDSQQREREAIAFLQKGRDAEAAGKLGAARIYYQMAERRSQGELLRQAHAHLQAIRSDASARIAHRDAP